MAWDGQKERRKAGQPAAEDRRGALWTLPDGQRLPNAFDAAPLGVGDPAHPARLRPSDLENPEDFRTRLTAWLLRQR